MQESLRKRAAAAKKTGGKCIAQGCWARGKKKIGMQKYLREEVGFFRVEAAGQLPGTADQI